MVQVVFDMDNLWVPGVNPDPYPLQPTPAEPWVWVVHMGVWVNSQDTHGYSIYKPNYVDKY